MTENGRKLKELRDDLEALTREHAEILAKENAISQPLQAAAREARRKFKVVTEGNAHPLGLNE